MAGFVEDQITNFIMSDYYNSLPSDFDKRQALKIEISEFRQEARDRVMNPDRTRSQSQILRLHRAMFYDLPKRHTSISKLAIQRRFKREIILIGVKNCMKKVGLCFQVT